MPDDGDDRGDDSPIGLGLRFSAEDPGLVAVFAPRAEHRGAPGFLHGGLAATGPVRRRSRPYRDLSAIDSYGGLDDA